MHIQSPLVIVDSSVSGKMSTITSNSTITGEIHAKIDNWSAQSVHYNGKFHFYEIHYYERRLYFLKLFRYSTQLSAYVAPLAFGFMGIARSCSVYCTICVTLERYYATAKPFTCNGWIKKKLMPLTFAFAVFYNIPK